MESINEENMEAVCELLDKLTLKQLHLMEEKMCCELNIETSINNGSIQLAKSRYIMGHSSVSASKLPVVTSTEFSASTMCDTTEEDDVRQLKVIENASENTVKPMHWFGVLVPQNLHKAQSIFQNAINFVVECVNIQLQINENLNNLQILNEYKKILQTS